MHLQQLDKNPGMPIIMMQILFQNKVLLPMIIMVCDFFST